MLNLYNRDFIWSYAEKSGWGYRYRKRNIAHIIFELSRLPNFAEPRFRELGEQLSERKAAVVRLQLRMLRELYSLGADYGLSMRLRRDGQRLRLFVVIRQASEQPLPTIELDSLARRIQQMFPKEYHFQRIDENSTLWQQALDVAWAEYVEELLKPEVPYAGPDPNFIPFYYVASLWKPQSLNDMETVCRSLLTEENAMVEVCITPTKIDQVERNWVGNVVENMREARRGQMRRSDGKILPTHDPMPILQNPLENYEDWLKRYDGAPVFLYTIRIFSATDPSGLAQTLAATTTQTTPQILRLQRNDALMEHEVAAAYEARILPEAHSSWWDESNQERPWRAQRLHRLADLEEIASFWRLPIPVRAGFPGFELDVGDNRDKQKSVASYNTVWLGTYTEGSTHTALEAHIDLQGLTKHGLIVGVPGSGKTTTMFSLLHQLWSSEQDGTRVPFIVLEPAKTEYRALKTLPTFHDDMLVFTLGDERISPFRFNPFEVPDGIPLESHIARLNACFVGAFNLFDPLPLLLDQAIREAYAAKNWFEDSVGGELDLEFPTLEDVHGKAENALKRAGYTGDVGTNIKAALLQRISSLIRGSKGRMLNTSRSIPFKDLMARPVVLELDSLNGDEKALLMMFLLTFVYEHAKATRHSGSPLQHVLIVEEAHNLIGRNQISSDTRANPQVHAIRLFIQMLAEMRALGQGILIADQLPTAIAPEAMKQTNLKLLMRMTSMDDRTEIGNTMDLDAEHSKAVSRFQPGQAYIYHEGLDRVRQIQTINFKDEYGVAQPPSDIELAGMMDNFEQTQASLYRPFSECSKGCHICHRRTRAQVEQFLHVYASKNSGRENIFFAAEGVACDNALVGIARETRNLRKTWGSISPVFPFCVFVHLLHYNSEIFRYCKEHEKTCHCRYDTRETIYAQLLKLGTQLSSETD